MKKISLDRLSLYSPWPARFLGSESFETEARTVHKIMREYDTDKYGQWLLGAKKGNLTSESVDWLVRGKNPEEAVCFSRHDELFEASAQEAFDFQNELFVSAMRSMMETCDTVIELGAGYGYRLAVLKQSFPDHTYIGGEISPKGIELGALLHNNISITPFNFYDEEWGIFDELKDKKCLVFTYHSVEMIPDAILFIDRLKKYKDVVKHIALFEPLYEFNSSDSKLNLLRKKYIEANDYCTNIYSSIKNAEGLEVHTLEYDMFGANPLFPESFVHTTFT